MEQTSSVGGEGAVTASEPTLGEIFDALAHHVATNGTLRGGVGAEIAGEKGWSGRLVDVLGVLTEDASRMGYLAGGRKPEEVASWLPLWASSPFSLEEIRTIVTSGGWDPEPFAVLVREGLLDPLVRLPEGSLRRVSGELAGAWLSDNFALASDEDILRAVRAVLDGDRSSPGSRPDPTPASAPAEKEDA